MPVITTFGNQLTTRNTVASTIPQKPSSGRPDRVTEVEHVPRQPEDERAEQRDRDERGERDSQTAGDQGADPEHAQHHASDRAHR